METQTQSKLVIHPDVKAKVESKKWFYTDTVKEHFFNPRNILISDDESNEYEKNASGIGMVGSASCGDSMKFWIKIDNVLKLKPQDVMARLGGLPNRKFHCSVLGDKALRSAINDYFRRSNQTSRIIVEGARIIDPETKTTDKDIEEAVLDGALTIEDVQKKLKVGIGNKAVVPAVEELIRFYKEKYFG